MTSVAHTLVAVSIASKITNPLIAFPLCFFSNFVLDMVPHWDFGIGWRKKTKTKLFLEGFLDVSLSYFLTFVLQRIFFPQTNLLYLFACVFLAQLPDWLEVPYLLFNIKLQPFTFFYYVQHFIHRKLDLPWGLVSQFAVAIPLLYLAAR